MTAAVILAAGAASRMGRPKAMLQLDRESLVRRTVRQALAARLKPAVVVVGSHSHEVQAELSGLDVRFASNPHWNEGLSSSIRCGIEAVEILAPTAESAILMVSDQPLLDAAHLRRLRRNFDRVPGRMVASAYAGTVGTPALFDASLFPDLKKLSGDRGAGILLRRRPGLVISLSWPEGEIDLDWPEDLERVRRRLPPRRASFREASSRRGAPGE